MYKKWFRFVFDTGDYIDIKATTKNEAWESFRNLKKDRVDQRYLQNKVIKVEFLSFVERVK